MAGVGIGPGLAVLGAFGPSLYSPLTECCELDGINERITFGAFAQTQPQPTDVFTVSIWVRCLPIAASFEVLIGNFNLATTSGWMLYRNTSGNPYLQYTQAGGNLFWAAALVDIADGRWHEVTATNDGTGDETGLSIYVDGALPAQSNGSAGGAVTAINYAGAVLTVGYLQNGAAANFLEGRVLHSFCLGIEASPEQVALLFPEEEQPVVLTGVFDVGDIVHWCTLGDGCTIGAGNCPDLSPLGNDGTSINLAAADFTVDDLPPTAEQADYAPATLSVQMNGVDELSQYARASGNQFDIDTDFTLAIWFKTTSVVVYEQFFGRYNESTHGDGLERGYEIVHMNGVIRLNMATRNDGDTDGGVKYFDNNDVTYNDGNWHFVAISIDQSGAWPALVAANVDGGRTTEADWTTSQSGTFANGELDHDSVPLYVGGGQYGLPGTYRYMAGNYFHAAMYKGIAIDKYDLFRIWSEGAAQDLLAIDNAEYVSFWDTMGNGDGVGAGNMIDLSTNGNDGTYVNGDSGDFVADVP